MEKESESVFDYEKALERICTDIKKYQDFPKKGVLFWDFFSLLTDIELRATVNRCMIWAVDAALKAQTIRPFNCVVGLETRGFVVGMMVADHFKVPFVAIRKSGKLPGECEKREYGTEYSSDAIEIQKDALANNKDVLIADDLVATGGTLKAAEQLVEQVGGVVSGYLVLFELVALKGREKLKYREQMITLISD